LSDGSLDYTFFDRENQQKKSLPDAAIEISPGLHYNFFLSKLVRAIAAR
jgi:hypothetical protein